MPISTVSFDLSSICSARGVNINRPEEISTSQQNEIQILNDLSGLLKIKSILEELDTNLSGVERFSNPTAIKLSQALNSVEGQTGFDRYLQALVSICENEQCSNLPRVDRARGTARLNFLRVAESKLSEIKLSQPTLARLLEIESQQTEVGAKKTLAAVKILIEQMASDLNLNPSQLNENDISQEIVGRCQAGVYTPIVPPPIQPPPPPPPPSTVEPQAPLNFFYQLELSPVWGISLGQEAKSFEAGPSLHGRIGLGIDFQKFWLKLDYFPFKNVANDFSYTRGGQDFAALTVGGKVSEVEILGQLSYLWLNNYLENSDEHVGAAGVGVSLFNGLLYPFAGGIFGTEFGGYGGVRSSYEWEKGLGISAEVLYSYLESNQIGGSVEFYWKTPVKLGNSYLTVGASLGGNYNPDQNGGNLLLGITFGLRGNAPLPQPVRFGGF